MRHLALEAPYEDIARGLEPLFKGRWRFLAPPMAARPVYKLEFDCSAGITVDLTVRDSANAGGENPFRLSVSFYRSSICIPQSALFATLGIPSSMLGEIIRHGGTKEYLEARSRKPKYVEDGAYGRRNARRLLVGFNIVTDCIKDLTIIYGRF